MKKIGIIHTTAATISSLNGLIKEYIEDVEVINLLDDSILNEMKVGNVPEYVKTRWMIYAEILERLGVVAVLSACSTVGDFADEANTVMGVPVYRIDEAMCEKAVETGNTISVFATLSSTLTPTVKLLERKAEELGKTVKINTVLVDGAYSALTEGNTDLHDQKIAEALVGAAEGSDVIVLAQASMASAVPAEILKENKVLTSPVLGIQKIKSKLSKITEKE